MMNKKVVNINCVYLCVVRLSAHESERGCETEGRDEGCDLQKVDRIVLHCLGF